MVINIHGELDDFSDGHDSRLESKQKLGQDDTNEPPIKIDKEPRFKIMADFFPILSNKLKRRT